MKNNERVEWGYFKEVAMHVSNGITLQYYLFDQSMVFCLRTGFGSLYPEEKHIAHEFIRVRGLFDE